MMRKLSIVTVTINIGMGTHVGCTGTDIEPATIQAWLPWDRVVMALR